MVGGIAVGGTAVGNGSVGTGVAVARGGVVGSRVGVSLGLEATVLVGSGVSGDRETAVFIGEAVFVCIGVTVIPAGSSEGRPVGCAASAGG